MKTALVFYSYDGNCTFVAKQIKAQLDADLIQLQTKDEKRRHGFAKMLWGGSMAALGKKPELKPYVFDPAPYDLIVIGAPVWAGHPAPPVQTFLSQTSITGKKVALFVCHAGGKGKSLKKFRALLAANDIVAEADFVNPAAKISDETKQQISDWIKTIGG
jgi:flavodoxin